MHMIYHLPVEFYQVVRRKPRDLSATAKDRLIALKVWRSLRESGLSAEQSMDMVEEMVPEEKNKADMMEDKPMESEASGQEYVTWDYFNFPPQFPEYSDRRIQKPFMIQNGYSIIIGIEGSSVQAIEE